jgi:hypothetical protein
VLEEGSRDRAVVSRTAWAGVCALVLVAPFEGQTPLVELPGQLLTSVETALVCVFSAWLAALAWTRRMPVWRTPLTLPWVVLLAVMLVAAVAAPVHRTNAMHMVGRFGVGLGVFLLTVNGVTTRARLRGVLAAAAAAAAIVSALVVTEYLGVAFVTEWLQIFRDRVTVIGPQVRAAGPFQYPTIASMYLEILFALILALLVMTFDARRRALSVVVFLLLLSIAAAVTLTFTRAGLVTMASTMGIVGLLRYRRQGVDNAVKAIAALAVLIAVQFLASRPAESVLLRMTTEGQQSWYSASVEAPTDIEMAAGGVVSIPVRVTNTGRSTWDPAAESPFLLSYHWLAAVGEEVVEFEGLRTAFPYAVSPGASIAVDARVKAPGVPGRYRLLWDVVLERRLWFSSDPNAKRFYSTATVTGPAVGPPPVSRVTAIPRANPIPSRLALWRTGAQMVTAHPLLGVGPDNFRLTYGEYAGLSQFDTRMHSNNMYLEMLVGGGIVGGVAFAWLCASAAAAFVRSVRRAGRQMAAAAAGVAAAGAAIAFHGMVDSFLSFTATYVLIAITLGLAVASAAMENSAAKSPSKAPRSVRVDPA